MRTLFCGGRATVHNHAPYTEVLLCHTQTTRQSESTAVDSTVDYLSYCIDWASTRLRTSKDKTMVGQVDSVSASMARTCTHVPVHGRPLSDVFSPRHRPPLPEQALLYSSNLVRPTETTEDARIAKIYLSIQRTFCQDCSTASERARAGRRRGVKKRDRVARYRPRGMMRIAAYGHALTAGARLKPSHQTHLAPAGRDFEFSKYIGSVRHGISTFSVPKRQPKTTFHSFLFPFALTRGKLHTTTVAELVWTRLYKPGAQSVNSTPYP